MLTGQFPATDDEVCGRCNRELDFYRLDPMGVNDSGLIWSMVVCAFDCTTTMTDMKT
jgi:hypothetical protein